ncbi:MAG: ribokinase [Methyloceanibacter sp.]
MTSIVVIGSINLDIVARAARLPTPGAKVTDAELTRHPGGGAANQALAARRLGADVALIGRVGSDAAADTALVLLRESGVDLSGVAVMPDEPTGVALVAVAESGENQIVVAPGANLGLSTVRLPIPTADALIGEHLAPEDAVVRAIESFEGFTCVVLASASDVDETVLRDADLIVVNESEAAWYGDSLATRDGLVAKTFGASGAALYRGGQELARAPAPAVTAIDTTGAGDAFTAALTVALVEGRSHAEALNFACAAGAIATQRSGAQPSLPTRDEVDRVLKEND